MRESFLSCFHVFEYFWSIKLCIKWVRRTFFSLFPTSPNILLCVFFSDLQASTLSSFCRLSNLEFMRIKFIFITYFTLNITFVCLFIQATATRCVLRMCEYVFFFCCFCINLLRTCAFSIFHFDWYILFDKIHSIPSLLPTQMKVNQKRAHDTLYPLWWGELEEQVQTELEPAHHNLRDYITRCVRVWEKSKILPSKKVKKRRLTEMVPIQAHTQTHTRKKYKMQ